MKNLLLLFCVACLNVSCSYVSTRTESVMMKIHPGMKVEQVQALLGTPTNRRFMNEYEQWEYNKYNPIGGTSKTILINIVDGCVSGMDSFDNNNITVSGAPNTPNLPSTVDGGSNTTVVIVNNRPQIVYPGGGMQEPIPMDVKQFDVLYNNIKTQPFTDDKMRLLSSSLGRSWFTCAQCGRIMSIFSFDDERLEVLKLFARRLVDPVNSKSITDNLTFNSDKEKAQQIIANAFKK